MADIGKKLAKEKARGLSRLYREMHRQLENKDYDPIRWAFDSAKLAKFLVYSEDMHTARHVLASTTKILDDFKTMDQANSKQEEFQFCYANLNRWWAAYCHELLTARLPHLLKDGDRVVVHTVHGLNMEWIGGDNTGFDIKLTPEEFASWRSRCGEVIFASLDTRVLEDQITDQFVLTQRDAEKVVQFAVQKLTNARKYFRSDTHPLNYAEIQIITYRLYFYWANFYEKDGARKCKIYKKGANELEALVAMSSPQYPKDILKKARFSLGTTYSKMLDIKMHRVDQVQKSDEMAINKINKLCVKGITHFTAYLESSCQFQDQDGPEHWNRMLALFHCAKFYHNIITDKQRLLENMTESLKRFNCFISFCEECPWFGEAYQEEFNMSKKTSEGLAKRIAELKSE